MEKVKLKVGQQVEVLFTDPPPKLSELIRNVWLPIKILAEYEYFFLAEVLPHINPKQSWGISKPYRVTLDKFALSIREVKIRYVGKEGS